MILPVSSFLASDAAERRAYGRILNVVSRPLMRTLAETYRFAKIPAPYPDGISSNFVFDGSASARHAWRYLGLSPHVAYMADVLERTIRGDMLEESRYLPSHGQARSASKEKVEMPDAQLDRVIRSIQSNKGEVSGTLRREAPILEQPGLWEEIVQAVSPQDNRCPSPDRPASGYRSGKKVSTGRTKGCQGAINPTLAKAS